MTASKEMSRPVSQHRLSVGSPAANFSRAHSTSLGAAIGNHRVGRRKSSSFAPAAIGAVVEHAALNRRASKAFLTSLNDEARPPLPHSLPQRVSVAEATALVDGPALSTFPSIDKAKQRRRASDGSRLVKREKAAANGDLKCEHCGKTYKHGSCLTKHLWEHTPQWQYTSKLLISKHQQVQLLEAASVLVAMNQDGPAGNDSEGSSSRAASATFDPRDEMLSSAETTPPPHNDSAYRDSKRYSTSSSAYSRSYQSVFSAESAPKETGFSHHRGWSTSSNRPLTAGTSIAESYPLEDPADLAAAVGLLSCSYGTPKTGPTVIAGDIPPVPPLPAKYQEASIANAYARYHHDRDDVEMDDQILSDDERMTRHDDVEYGVFGRMDA